MSMTTITGLLHCILISLALLYNFSAALPIRTVISSESTEKALDFPGFTVCNAGDSAMNGFYSQVDASSFQLNTSTFQHKNMLFFDVTPLPHMKGPYGWELYSYTLLHKPVTKYIVSVEDFVDPPQHGWAVYGNATAPAPVVLKGDVPCQ
jgi:hypothetical protein